jgi:hypothetical protein
MQRDGCIQRGLTAKSGQQRIRTFLRDNHLHEVGVDGLDVGGIGELGSVMIVAGLELTKITRKPSSRSTRQAWVPE